MFFLNLTLGQFLVLFTSVSALTIALYLLDRSRRRQVVSTLRFWVMAEQPPAAQRRKRIQQPFSLLLQLLSMALLLLAIAELRWGSKAGAPRDHVVLLDCSAWMASHSPDDRGKTLMDVAKDRARAYVKAVPAKDRVMLVRADALTTPATAFEFDRKKVNQAIQEASASSTALDLEEATAFARRLQEQSGRRAGEITYVGPGRITEQRQDGVAKPVQNLRLIQVADRTDNCGIRKMSVHRSAADPNLWDVFVAARNYGAQTRPLTLVLGFGGAPVGMRSMTLPPGADKETTFEVRTKAAGLLEARLQPGDDFAADDRAVLELSPSKNLKVTIYSDEPELLRPVFTSNPAVSATFKPTAEYRPDNNGSITILDRFRPALRPANDAVWIDPPAQGSPIPVKERATATNFTGWISNHALGAGLHNKDIKLDSSSVFLAAPTDVRVGEAQAGPVIVARDGNPKTVVMGFHPARTPLRYELAMPLLFANIMRWMNPQIFRHAELNAGSVGAIATKLDTEAKSSDVRVVHEDGSQLPFTLRNGTVQFFAGRPGTVRVEAGNREYIYSLTLPQLWDTAWKPAQDIKHGVPRAAGTGPGSVELWQWLAAAGAAVLLIEWYLFGRYRRGLLRPVRAAAAMRKAS